MFVNVFAPVQHFVDLHARLAGLNHLAVDASDKSLRLSDDELKGWPKRISH